MSTKYPQGVITATPPFQSTTAQSFSGVWTLEQLGKNYFYYQQPVAKSLRFRSSASAYLNRTPSTGGNRTTWTWSGWVKRGTLGVANNFFVAGYGSTPWFIAQFQSDNTIQISTFAGSSAGLITSAVFRDPSAWYHIVIAFDTTQAAAVDRVRLYVNGIQQTSFSTSNYPTQNTSYQVNNTVSHTLGGYTGEYFDGYLAEVNFIDGQALDASYFGQLSAITGVWAPKKYVGSYGGNGFYLPFTDATSTTTLGYDYSGNGNNWTTNNISLTSGSTYDSMWDSPTSYDNGVNGVGNYAVLNPLSNVGTTITNGNLTVDTGISNGYYVLGSIAIPSTGKWYWEYTPTVNGALSICGIWVGLGKYVTYFGVTGEKYVDGVASAYGAAYTDNDVIGVAVNADSGSVTFYKNNSSQGAITYTVAGYFPYFADGTGGSGTTLQVNFGQRPFAYTPPTGFKALNTQNLPAVSIANGANHMAATLYTGTGTAQNIVNAANSVSFQPDFVWGKCRSAGSTSNWLENSITGAGLILYSDQTAAEQNNTTYLPSFNTNGFSVAGNTSYFNASGSTYVAWQWKAGGTAVTNTAGSITSSVSANTTSGFSVVTYTGTGSNATVGHGLGVQLGFLIVKNRTSSGTSWACWHTAFAGTERIDLNSTNAKYTDTTAWNSTVPSSTVFSVGTAGVNTSGNAIVAYCFAAIPGYSAFGSYTGNGSSDGPFVYCGFRPRWVMIKCTSTATPGVTYAYWIIFDSSRNKYNVVGNILFANDPSAEVDVGTALDILSNGFKVRDSNGSRNASGETYIYAAFAENPFKYSLAR